MMRGESPQASRGVFLLWNISFNALDSGLRDFLFGPLEISSIQIPAGFPEIAPYGSHQIWCGSHQLCSVLENQRLTSVAGRILCGSHRMAYGPYENLSDPVFRPFSCKISNET